MIDRNMIDRKWMLAALAIGILVYGVWTAFLIYFSLLADSGKDSNPVLAIALLWPLAELIWCWIWIFQHGDQYSRSSRRALGNVLLMLALIVPVPVDLAESRSNWVWLISLAIAVTVAGCWGARFAWSRNQGPVLSNVH